MFSGGDEEAVSTGTNSKNETTTTEEKPAAESGEKIVDATAQSMDAAGMKVNLGEIKISKDKIKVGINIENTTDAQLMFYPDQGSAVVGDMQLDANMFLTDGSIGGEVQAGVKQEGVLEFLAPEGKEIDVEAIKEIKLLFGDVITDDFMTTKPVDFTIPVQ